MKNKPSEYADSILSQYMSQPEPKKHVLTFQDWVVYDYNQDEYVPSVTDFGTRLFIDGELITDYLCHAMSKDEIIKIETLLNVRFLGKKAREDNMKADLLRILREQGVYFEVLDLEPEVIR